MALTGQQEEAAALVAADQLTDQEICDELGLKSRKTLWNWKQTQTFTARVDAFKGEVRAAVRASGIAVIENRVAHLADRHRRMQRVIRERAADESFKDVPGGGTGLLLRTYKKVGSGEDSQLVPEYAVDTALLKEMRETEKQVAIELGQWQEKQEVTQRGSVNIRTITAVQPQLPAPSGPERR